MRRIVITGLAAAALLGLARRMRGRLPKLMERMMEDVMPNMMGACFAQMKPERRKFMLAHCRGMLDRVEEECVTAEAP